MSVYTVYRTTNITNGMFYIGVHKTKNPNDDYLGSGKRLKYAIAKYGVENFQKEVLFVFSTREEAYSKEKELVTEETLDSGSCYNLKIGGDGGWDYCNGSRFNIYENHSKTASLNLSKSLPVLAKLRESDDWSSMIAQRISIALKQKYKNGWEKKINYPSQEGCIRIGQANSIYQSGKGNSQFGTMWITDGILNKKIKKDQEIPEGWRKGRICTDQASRRCSNRLVL